MSDISTTNDDFNAETACAALGTAIQDLAKSLIEIRSGIGCSWYDTVIVTNDMINNHNLIVLPNERFFTDFSSKSLLVFVNNTYIAPHRYRIINKTAFYFLYDDIKVNDIVHVIHFDKITRYSNTDSHSMAIAKAWEYSFTNESSTPLLDIDISDEYSFTNQDQYSLLVYINGGRISPEKYEISNARTLTLQPTVSLKPNETIMIMQLGRVLPNDEYIGYLWGESIDITEETDTITISNNHSFSNIHDTSALVFVNNILVKNYRIISTSSIKFSAPLSAGSHIEILQLGYTTDLDKIKDTLDIETIKNLLDIDLRDYIKEPMRNKANGFVGINEDGYIDSSLLDINGVSQRIKNRFVEQGWLPFAGERTNHVHNNMDVLWRLQLYNGKLYVNGYPVGEKAIEVMQTITLTEEMINNCKIKLPDDCDVDRPITVVINSVPQLHDNDWIIIENEWPVLDEISWKNKQLQNILEVGDIVSITYYKKTNKIQEPLPPSDMGYNHWHQNMQLLEALSINELNQLCIDGKPIEADYIEVDRDIIITDEDINNKYIELPDDCDDSNNRPIVVTVESSVMAIGIDYRVIINEDPIKDRIDWNGLGLEDVLQSGDTICITYYKKN